MKNKIGKKKEGNHYNGFRVLSKEKDLNSSYASEWEKGEGTVLNQIYRQTTAL